MTVAHALRQAPLQLGRYQLLAPLARGGMAELYLARMTAVGGFAKLLVIKRMLPHLTDDPTFHQMFLDEARIAAQLDHPNICHVYELGEVGGELFLAMEYLPGLAWSELVGRIPRTHGYQLRCAAGVLGQICDGLRYAHELHDVAGNPTPVIHRDVSPHNLMVTTSGVCKLLDFGVSKVLTEGNRTRTGMLKGKLPYMAPEQIRGEPVDQRSDVFSMGVVLWEALTGERLFARDNDFLICHAVIDDPIPPVTASYPELPPAIDAVVGAALERNPARRFPTIRMFGNELRRVADAVGGALDSAALAELVLSLGARELAERASLVGSVNAPAGPSPVIDAGETIPDGHSVISDTHSVQLRDQAVPLARSPRRYWWLAVLVVAAGLGVGVALWSATDDQPLAVASVVIDAAPPSPPPLPPPTIRSAEPEIEMERPASDVTPPQRPKAKPTRARPPTAAEPGLYSIDSRPYATIYIDGKSYGATPLFRVPLAPGRHQVKAVRADGRSQQVTVRIEPGQVVSSGTLSW